MRIIYTNYYKIFYYFVNVNEKIAELFSKVWHFVRREHIVK